MKKLERFVKTLGREKLETIATNFSKLNYVQVCNLAGTTIGLIITSASAKQVELTCKHLRRTEMNYNMGDVVKYLESIGHYAAVNKLTTLTLMVC